jgi:anti-sigma factor ChrR (cupin superfamily)
VRLTELEPEWVMLVPAPPVPKGTCMKVDTLPEADGIFFLCPKCWMGNGGRREGVHQILCWQPNVPQDVHPVPGRWKFEGTSFEDLTLVAGSSSVALVGGCEAHFWIRNGEISFA